MALDFSPSMTLLAADAMLVLHFFVAAFNVLALPLVWLGLWRGWRLGRSRGLRVAHLACMGVTALIAVSGELCPLTEWESALREAAGRQGYGASFVAHWLGRLLYVDAPLALLAGLYAAWACASLLTWLLAPPGLAPSGLARSGARGEGPGQKG